MVIPMNPMLSQTSEYALRAILYLARVATSQPVSADVIAEALDAPRNYLSKTLNALAKRGLVSSTRGPQGGFRLAVEPEALTIAEVIHAFDEPRRRSICMLGGQRCDDRQPCTVHVRWKAVATDMWAPVKNTTIADLLRGELDDQSIAGMGAGIPGQAADAVGLS
jgi:Rrf2 family transcriptional regulator, iron-sulfur cluster assembly transcription factor